jgi:mRNA-degrading endonuclease RelE of RelBE toxin-antitoxin system
MSYAIEYNFQAAKDMRKLSPDVARRVVAKIERSSKKTAKPGSSSTA